MTSSLVTHQNSSPSVGVSHIEKHLRQLKKSRRLPHAFLIHGVKGCQSVELGILLSRIILCENEEMPACGTCPSCAELMHLDSHPDFLRVLPTGKMRQIKREHTNAVLHFLSLKPLGISKVILIEEADRLNPTTANALLKVLEEPPENTYFIMLTHQKDHLMQTILSRTYSIELPPLSFDVMKPWLETFHADKGDVRFLYLLCGGYPKLLSDETYRETCYTRNLIKQLVRDVKERGIPAVLDFCEMVFKESEKRKKDDEKEFKAALKDLDFLEGESRKLQEEIFIAESEARAKGFIESILHQLLLFLRDLLLLNENIPLDQCFFQDDPEILEIGQSRLTRLQNKISALTEEIRKIHSTIQLKLFFENCLLQAFF